jgi:hypothetical protein
VCNLAPLPGDVDFTVGASLPISGLTAWQGLFEHGRLQPGQSVLVHGAAGRRPGGRLRRRVRSRPTGEIARRVRDGKTIIRVRP